MGAHWSPVASQRRCWELIAKGCLPDDVADAVGVSGNTVRSWLRQRGGVNPRLVNPKARSDLDCRRWSAMKSRSARLAVSRNVRSRPGLIGRRRRSCANLPTMAAAGHGRVGIEHCIVSVPTAADGTPNRDIGPALPKPAARRGRVVPRLASWTATPSCARRSKSFCERSTVPNRSWVGCPRCIPIVRRCACRTKPSTSTSTTAFTCKDAASCAASCRRVCAPDARCV
ncbi:MAG: hypothetical protein QOC58_2518, partial [Mycobacterium sp.]|nr:hypothetical protein [Mycobacterium sp.]